MPNGGYVTSAFLMVARMHMLETNSSRNSPHPINLHLEFLRRTSASEAFFTVTDVKLGARISNLHITLSQRRDPNQPKIEDKVTGYVMMSNMATETGLSLQTEYKLQPPRLPTNLPLLADKLIDDNYVVRGKDPFVSFRRAVLNIQMFLLRADRKESAHLPISVNDQWVRFSPGGTPNGRWTNDALGFLVDMFPQTIERYINDEGEKAAIATANGLDTPVAQSKIPPKAPYWYPTLVLNLDVKKLLPEEGVEWLFVRVRAKTIKNGRFDLDIEVWDEAGDLVATSVHAALVVDAARNLAGRTVSSTAKAKSKL